MGGVTETMASQDAVSLDAPVDNPVIPEPEVQADDLTGDTVLHVYISQSGKNEWEKTFSITQDFQLPRHAHPDDLYDLLQGIRFTVETSSFRTPDDHPGSG